jgi:hypothetical protein
MSAEPDALGDLYVAVTGEETVTESQREGPSRDPIDEETASVEEEVSRAVTEDGLDDTVEGIEADL